MCIIMTVANQKGGVGKTTTVLNLATALAGFGKKVLVVDADPQGNLTICAGVSQPDHLHHTTYSLLNTILDEEDLPDPAEFILTYQQFDLIPSNISLSAIELNRGHEIGCERALKSLLDPLKSYYDYIVIDTSPSLGILTVNAITASDFVLITVTPQLLSAIGLKLLIRTIEKVKKHVNPAVRILGVLMTMCDTRTNLYKDVSDILQASYQDQIRIFNTVIPPSTKVGEANLHCQSVLLYDPHCKPAIAYQAFAKEMMADV